MQTASRSSIRVTTSWTGKVSQWTDRRLGWLLAAPAVVLFLALSIYPLAYSLWVDFVDYDFSIPGHAFVGLENFVAVIKDPVAQASLLHTIVLAGASVIVELVLGLGLALAMLNPFSGRRVVMPILITPLFVSPVIVGQFWSLLLQRPFGPTDYVLSQILGHPVSISWLTEFPWNYIAIIAADVWQWTPFMFVILLAGLTAIPEQIYEAADIDGANWGQVFVLITFPLLTPMVLLAVTFRLVDAAKLFDVIYVMTGGGPGTDTYTASFYLYQTGFQQFHLSQATAGSWIFLMMITSVVAQLVRQLVESEAK